MKENYLHSEFMVLNAEECTAMGKMLFMTYAAFKAAGFSTKEAFELVKVMVQSSLQSGKRE